VTADTALRFFVVLLLHYLTPQSTYRSTAWYLVTALLMAPAVLLAPLNGAISNSLPKPLVLIGSAAYGLIVTALAALALGADADHGWLLCWGLVALGSAVYGPTRYALLPAAADDTRWPLTRLNGLVEMGAAVAVVAGMVLALWLSADTWMGHPATAVLVVVLNGAALVFALPVRFPSDVRRPEPALQAVRDFFADARAIWRGPEARVCLLGLALLRGAATGLTGALLPRVLDADRPDFAHLLEVATWVGWVMAGLALGSLLAGMHGHPRRVLGLVPLGALGLVVALGWAATPDIPGPGLLALFGVMAGLANVPLAATYQADLPADARGNGMSVRNFTDYTAVAITSVGLFVLAGPLAAPPWLQLGLLAAACGVAAIYAAWFFRRETSELVFETVLLPLYRFQVGGPGVESFPRKGPVLVIANHSAWLDPVWLGKVLPRSVIAMMTSVFFDVPVLRWMMVHLARAIRVEAASFRRDVPELREAVAALDQGECLLVFPEGAMRRRDDIPLRMFGRGVWHILRERPHTPVVVCWIEGGWGSYFSYKGGPPTRNKRLDFLRLIRIAIGPPHLLSSDVLADQRRTRLELMQECLRMRQHLGLEAHALDQSDEESSLETQVTGESDG
jgi:1-acyl-sn-glycerol-3-phosphate acyltransferase